MELWSSRGKRSKTRGGSQFQIWSTEYPGERSVGSFKSRGGSWLKRSRGSRSELDDSPTEDLSWTTKASPNLLWLDIQHLRTLRLQDLSIRPSSLLAPSSRKQRSPTSRSNGPPLGTSPSRSDSLLYYVRSSWAPVDGRRRGARGGEDDLEGRRF